MKYRKYKKHISKLIEKIDLIHGNYNNSLKELKREITPIIMVHTLKEMFELDAQEIRNDLSRKKIIKSHALKALEILKKDAKEIGRDNKELEERLFYIEKETVNLIEKILQISGNSVPIDSVIDDIIEDIDQTGNDLPKSNFGILEIKDIDPSEVRSRILTFLDDYHSGIIVLSKQQRKLIDEVSVTTNSNFDFSEKSSILICIFGNSK